MTDFGHGHVSRKALRPLEKGGDVFWNESRVYSRWEAWEYLFLSAARYADQTWMLRGGASIDLVRGETHPLSIRYLEKRFRWGKNKCSRFLSTLVQMNRIAVHQRTPDGDTYLVVNYGVFQGERDSGGTVNGTAAGQRRDSGGTKERKYNTKKKELTTLSDSLFEEAWAAYPKRPNNSKADALKAWTASVKEGADPTTILEGVLRYAPWIASEKARPDWQDNFIKQAATFFGPGRWWESDYHTNGAHNTQPVLVDD